MNLTKTPEVVNWPATHYVFIEKIGPFASAAPEAWKTAHSLLPAIAQHNKITGYLCFYKRGPKIYRAGFSLAAPPVQLPAGLESTEFGGGKYSRFVLTGPFTDLPAASGRVFEIVAEEGIEMRDDFCIENYVTDPAKTPPEETITHILIPTV